MELKDYIRNRRIELNLSQDRLGEMIGKNRQYIRRIENGETKTIKNDIVIELSKALKCPTRIFFEGFTEDGRFNNPHLGLLTENVEPLSEEEIKDMEEFNILMEEQGFVRLTAEDFYNEVIDLMSKTEDITEEKKAYIKQSLGFACDIKDEK